MPERDRPVILYLYTELMGYTLATIKELVFSGAMVHVVHWDRKKLSDYKVREIPGVTFTNRSETSFEGLRRLARVLSPDVTVVSGWQDAAYVGIAWALRREGRVVVCGFDDQWHGTLRQSLAGAAAKSRVLQQFYSHAWVSGAYQYEYARKVGFKNREIIFDLLSADIDVFDQFYCDSFRRKAEKFPAQFLYVGRYELIKGVDCLIDAWRIARLWEAGWTLRLIGSGSLKLNVADLPGLSVGGFLAPEEMGGEIANSGVLVVPSRRDQWGVAVHEFAAAGFPMILSDAVGAAPMFLIPGANGMLFRARDNADLARALTLVSLRKPEELVAMGELSHALARRITPRTSALNLLSLSPKHFSTTSRSTVRGC